MDVIAGWLLLVAALLALFVAWDLLFCGGQRCAHLVDRMAGWLPLRRSGRGHDEDDPDHEP